MTGQDPAFRGPLHPALQESPQSPGLPDGAPCLPSGSASALLSTEQSSDPLYAVKSGSGDNTLPASAGPGLGRSPGITAHANVCK